VAGHTADGVGAFADRLTVGIRTIEGHLLRIYAKVGVRSRRELAEVFVAATTERHE
jgi:DNA-binding CsgD family transcriptional regulator